MRRIVIYHAAYGCDTGCCGHVIKIDDEEHFLFAHPKHAETDREFAERLLKQEFSEGHLADLDWNNCLVVSD